MGMIAKSILSIIKAKSKSTIKKFIRWTMTSKMLVFPRRIFARIIIYGIQTKGLVLISYSDSDRKKVIELTHKIKNEREMLLADNEAYQLFMAVRRTEKIQGDIAEVGVYKGGSAKIICEAKGNKFLHLFDTFNGIPNVEEIDKVKFFKGQYKASIEEVKNYLKQYNNVLIYEGIFPDDVVPEGDSRFSFIHLDVDTYKSTLKCLKYFYPRINPGGIIISHDYISAPGVKKAIDEFFKDKIEPVVELSGSQCLIVKSGLSDDYLAGNLGV